MAMILDIVKFIDEERRYWKELEEFLNRLERSPDTRFDLDQIKRFHYLYQRTSADLVKLSTFSTEQQIRRYLETLVASAYAEIYESREKRHRVAPIKWFFTTFPRTFRLHIVAFYIAVTVMISGALFGGFVIGFDPESKEILLPDPHLRMNPAERVAQEEAQTDGDRLHGSKASFSSYLMTHNTKVSILSMGLGMTWGIGTILILFTNGVLLGAVVMDYILAGQSKFLTGWLLPHGAIEIPAFLIAAQAGLVIGYTIIGWKSESGSLRNRLRQISGDVVTLIFGVAILLIWAGIIEGFFSQYHAPVIPYEIKIGFGVVELILLTVYLTASGKEPSE